ncbi:RnfABCDGE type electron transport complex subunit B [Paracidovorax citrulli]|uniref:Electron transport complex, RnfABCDGE type, B subunit n=2 Tax=Paracidovorax citrulli TaxID=80869 RepID=A1TQ24_PARC0|nr:RnfABCDGE type electron transport complex subunit B [Paracidovorax citrulli]ABM33062.1 electron transport complex, RnfABCDGE type, B subunit [Paracidovorax citrulli AAC00-1]ATG92981.1 ferredoxin [Paracidovorax citrulli]MVT29035.1 RnfABCDGE type electron transport complex subunit B [Paracidovorax citrulli]PVY67291.1 electron transport complex protein RnfB [Paracidovorax citrulli]QCX09066.1 Electron transport complex subunit RsxB [Paracidovorax citrulli]
MTAPPPAAATRVLAARIDAALPQTQCTRCGYPDCAAYADAVAEGTADINRCPPGGAEGIARLAALTGRAPLALDPQCGAEAPRGLAVIDELACIGCTLCIKACPTDAILGTHKRMHTVIEAHCTGCELCIPVCPVDCITMENATGDATGWAAWSATQAGQARQRYQAHRLRAAPDAERAPTASALEPGRATAAPAIQPGHAPLQEDTRPAPPASSIQPSAEDRRAAIAAALARARERRGGGSR